MSFPNIPDVTPDITIGRVDVENLLLASIAFEELGLAHITNAEAEKIQYVLGTLPGQTPHTPASFEDLLKINRSAEEILRAVIKKEMLLQFKLEDTIKIIKTPFPSINIEKFVSVDNGATWLKADVPPGPTLVSPANPMFKYVVTNTGNETLTLVSVSDSVLGSISVGGTLAPGATLTETRTGTFALGLQTNTATVTGVFQNHVFQDSDQANYTGVI